MIENIPDEFSSDITVLQKVTLTWHPYPQEKPTVSDRYLVTLRGRLIQFDAWTIDSKWILYSDDDVIAWAEMPKPYEG